MKFDESTSFEIEELGLINNGRIELKPLTIFCGPNNTGKTWAMYALYGCLSFLPPGMPLPELEGVATSLKNEGVYYWDIYQWVDSNYEKIIKLIHKGCKFRLRRIFNVDGEIFEKSKFNWIISKEKMLRSILEGEIDFRLEVGKQNDALRMLKGKGESVVQLTLLTEGLPDVSRLISARIVQFLLGQTPEQTVFLMPAERNGLHLFFRELSSRRNALLHHASRDEVDITKLINDVLKSRYAEPIADYIDWLNEIRGARRSRSDEFHPYAEELKKILGGKYEVDSEGDISFSPKKKRNQPAPVKLALHLTSSTVKSMFGLWFFLEHVAKPGDVLMIDEPELNLHPGAQRRIARFLASLSNSGLTVVVSTHSDYFVREVNSLMLLSSENPKTKKIMAKYDYRENEVLSFDNVRAHIFESGNVSLMSISEKEGILADTFDEVINDLNETSDSIFYELNYEA